MLVGRAVKEVAAGPLSAHDRSSPAGPGIIYASLLNSIAIWPLPCCLACSAAHATRAEPLLKPLCKPMQPMDYAILKIVSKQNKLFKSSQQRSRAELQLQLTLSPCFVLLVQHGCNVIKLCTVTGDTVCVLASSVCIEGRREHTTGPAGSWAAVPFLSRRPDSATTSIAILFSSTNFLQIFQSNQVVTCSAVACR